MITKRFPCWVVLLLPLVACSPKREPPGAPPPGSSTPATTNVAMAVPEELRAPLEALGKQLETDLRNGDTNAVRAVFDPVGIVDAILEGLELSGRQRDQFAQGMQIGIQSSLGTTTVLLAGQTPRFKGLVTYRGQPAVRFRFVHTDDAISFIDFVVHRDSRKRLSIVDFYNQALGYGMVEQGRQNAVLLVGHLNRSLAQRVFGQATLTQEDLKRFGGLAQQVASGDFAGVIRSYHSLPPVLRETLTATSFYLTAVQASGNEESYAAALKEAASRFKTANFQFMLLDLHTLAKEYDQALACLRNFEATVGEDATLRTLESLLLKAKGELPAARAALDQALRLEPDCLYTHEKGLDILLAVEDFTAVSRSLRVLEASGNYDFKGALTGPDWEQFLKSPESAPWR